MTTSVSPDGDSPIMRLLNVTYDDGSPVVKQLNWVEACLDCQRKGVADRCTHILRPPQHFQSYAGQDRIHKLMSFDPDAHDREMLNVGGKPSISAAFQKEWIDHMVSTKFSLTRTVHHLFVTVDPSAGKDRNYYAVMAIVVVDGECVIVGAECINCSDSLLVAAIVASLIKECRRRIRQLANALAVIIPESNLPFAAKDLCRDLKSKIDLDNYYFVMEDSSSSEQRFDLPGSMTTRRKKLEMVSLLIERYMRQNKIAFHRPFIVSQPDYSSVDDVQLEIVKQLRGFCEKRKYKTDADGATICERTFTGKRPVGHNDDFVITLMIGVYQEKRFWENPNNDKYHNGALPVR